jgi:O-antigen ligase
MNISIKKYIKITFYMYFSLILFAPISVGAPFILNYTRVFHVPLFYFPIMLLSILIFLKKGGRPDLIFYLLILFPLVSLFNFSHVDDLFQWIPYILMSFVNAFIYLVIKDINVSDTYFFIKKYIHWVVAIVLIGPVFFLIGWATDWINVYSRLGVNRNAIAFIYWSAFTFQFIITAYKGSFKNIALSLILLLAIIFTFSRTIYMLTMIVIMLFFYSGDQTMVFKYCKKGIEKLKFNKLKMFLSIVITLFAFSLLFGEFILPRLIQFLDATMVYNFSNEIGIHANDGRRQLLLIGSLSVFFDNLLLGVGAGQSWLNLPSYVTDVSGSGDAHNAYVRVLAENGLIGFFILSSAFYLLIKRKIKLRRFSKFKPHYDLNLVSIASLFIIIAIPFYALGSSYLITNPFVWLMISLSATDKSVFCQNSRVS